MKCSPGLDAGIRGRGDMESTAAIPEEDTDPVILWGLCLKKNR